MRETPWYSDNACHHSSTPLPEGRYSIQHNVEQLALALLLDVMHHQEAITLHLRFAGEVIAKLPQGRSPLFISRQEIMAWVKSTAV
jgi:hypothetical protein